MEEYAYGFVNSLYTAVAEPTIGVIDCQPIIDERESRNSESVPDNNTEMQGNREPTIDQREGRDRELVPDSNSETEGKCQLLEYTKVSRVLLLLLLHKRKYFSPFYL